VLAEACADGPLCEPAELGLHRRVEELDDEVRGPGWVEAVRNAVDVLKAAKRIRDDFDPAADPSALTAEVAPWAAAAAVEADAGLAALRLLQQLRPVASVDGADGRAAGIDAEAAMMTVFMVVFSWSGARRSTHDVFGPRFAFMPQIVQLPDGQAALDVHGAVREDANAIDALCRLALAEYDAWRAEPGTNLRVFVDGEERALDEHGRFDARGEMVLVRDSVNATRVATGARLPFRDARLA
jgi:hypothetical protein